MWSKPLLCCFQQPGKIPKTQALQGFAAFRLALSRIPPRHTQIKRDTNFATPGYSLSCHDTTASDKNKDFSVCGHLCGQSGFYAAFSNRGKSRKRRRRKALRRFASLYPGYNHGTPKQCAVSRTAHGRNKRRLPLKGAVFASRRERLSKQRHYNRQAAEKQEMEAGNLLFFEFRLYGGLDFCYNAENIRKAGTAYANEKKKQSGAADGGV